MDKPIIFSGPMVRAILDGRKTWRKIYAKAGGESRTETHRGRPHFITANPWIGAYSFGWRAGNIEATG